MLTELEQLHWNNRRDRYRHGMGIHGPGKKTHGDAPVLPSEMPMPEEKR